MNWQPFPLDALPNEICKYVTEAAKAIGCDPAGPALSALAGLASCIGNSRVIEIKPYTDYRPAVLWMAIIGESGSRKSPQVKEPLKSLRRLQEKYFDEHQAELGEYDAECRSAKRDKQPPPPPPPTCQRISVDDVTLEALAQCLEENRRGLLYATDELASWCKGFDRYRGGKGGDGERWLSIYDAAPLIVDRKGSRTICVKRAAVTLVGAIQPEVYRDCFEGAFLLNGMSARFLVCQPPKHPRRWTDDEVSEEAAEGLEHIYEKLRKLEWDADGEPRIIRLGADAKQVWIDFVNSHGKAGDDLTGHEAALHEKCEGHASRLALVIHCTRLVSSELYVPCSVDEKSVKAGIRLAEWFLQEARRIREKLHLPDHHRLAKMIVDNEGRITPRELVQKTREYPTTEQAERALNGLVKKGLASRRISQPKTGRPSTIFLASEEAFSLFPSTKVNQTGENSSFVDKLHEIIEK